MRARLDLRIDAELRTWLVKQSIAEARTITHIVERALCNERHASQSPALEAALGATTGKGRGGTDPQSSPAASPDVAGSLPPVPAPPRTPRPARDATSPEPIGKLVDTATGRETPVVQGPAFDSVPGRGQPTKAELDMQRQQKLNAKKKGSKT